MNKMTKVLSFAVAMLAIAGITGALSKQAFAGGTEGCSPGHWKNEAKRNPGGGGDWTNTGLNPDTLLLNTFFNPDFPELRTKSGDGTNPTLTEALNAKGGNENALAREVAAALANIFSTDVNYDTDLGELQTLVDAALADGSDAALNTARDSLRVLNHLGDSDICPLD